VRELDFWEDLPLAFDTGGFPHLMEIFPQLQFITTEYFSGGRSARSIDGFRYFYSGTEDMVDALEVSDFKHLPDNLELPPDWRELLGLSFLVHNSQDEEWTKEAREGFRRTLVARDGPFSKIYLSSLTVDAHIDLSTVIDFLHSRHTMGDSAVFNLELPQADYDLLSIIELLDASTVSPVNVKIRPPTLTPVNFTLDQAFSGIAWERYDKLRDLSIAVQVGRDITWESTPIIDFDTYTGPPLDLVRFRIAFHNEEINALDRFVMAEYALPLMSRLAKAMLAIGGPFCEYGVRFSHPRFFRDEITSASRALSKILRQEIQAILSIEPDTKGWRMLRKDERKGMDTEVDSSRCVELNGEKMASPSDMGTGA
jgi:hypothetical protein